MGSRASWNISLTAWPLAAASLFCKRYHLSKILQKPVPTQSYPRNPSTRPRFARACSGQARTRRRALSKRSESKCSRNKKLVTTSLLHKAINFLYSEKFSTKQEALKREKQVKGWRREKKLNLIKYGKLII